MIRLDMSEFMERHSVSKLIGSPPGYIGHDEDGQLTDAVHRRRHTVVLIDEIEKAHPVVFNIMLQILEDRSLTDSKGRATDFKNTILIMTSNIGSSVTGMGGHQIGFNEVKIKVAEELRKYFQPEFLNRLDEVIVFKQLTKMELGKVADKMLKEVCERFKAKKIKLKVTDEFKDRVVEEGYNPSYGARPLRRAIMRLLEDSLADEMISGEIEGDSKVVSIDTSGNVIIFNSS